MIIVMENGYATKAGQTPVAGSRDNGAFEELMVRDLVPLVDSNYRTLADRKHRAVAGLSMGAGQALQIGLGHLDLFDSIAAFSGGGRNFDPKISFGGIFADPVAANRRIRLLWLGCGKEDAGYASGKGFHEALTAASIKHVWVEGPGSHEWQVWRKHLFDLAPRLFQE